MGKIKVTIYRHTEDAGEAPQFIAGGATELIQMVQERSADFVTAVKAHEFMSKWRTVVDYYVTVQDCRPLEEQFADPV